MKLVEFIKGINDILTNNLTDISVYTRETTQGYNLPCIFTEVIPDIITPENKSIEEKSLQITLTYMDTKRDDTKFYKLVDTIHELFKKTIKITTTTQTRVLHISSFDFEFVGDNQEYIEFTIITRFYDIEETEESGDKIEEIYLETKGD